MPKFRFFALFGGRIFTCIKLVSPGENMKRNKLSLAVTSAMGIASIAGALATGAAYSDEGLEEIVVVGSRSKKTEGFESSSHCRCSEC